MFGCSLLYDGLHFFFRGKIVLGYTEAELRVRGSGYQFIHAADMLYCAENHVRSKSAAGRLRGELTGGSSRARGGFHGEGEVVTGQTTLCCCMFGNVCVFLVLSVY